MGERMLLARMLISETAEDSFAYDPFVLAPWRRMARRAATLTGLWAGIDCLMPEEVSVSAFLTYHLRGTYILYWPAFFVG